MIMTSKVMTTSNPKCNPIYVYEHVRTTAQSSKVLYNKSPRTIFFHFDLEKQIYNNGKVKFCEAFFPYIPKKT